MAPALLACPGCGRLVYADLLAALAETAHDATERGDSPATVAAWRQAVVLLPIDSKQHQVVAQKIAELNRMIAMRAFPPSAEAGGNGAATGTTTVGEFGLFLENLKALVVGLANRTTFLSMLLSLGVYWIVMDWKIAAGLVLSIYVHEMGHVIVLRRYGVQATAPVFIPGLGAFIRLQDRPASRKDEADIGLAGPIYGLAAAAVALGLWWVTEEPGWPRSPAREHRSTCSTCCRSDLSTEVADFERCLAAKS